MIFALIHIVITALVLLGAYILFPRHRTVEYEVSTQLLSPTRTTTLHPQPTPSPPPSPSPNPSNVLVIVKETDPAQFFAQVICKRHHHGSKRPSLTSHPTPSDRLSSLHSPTKPTSNKMNKNKSPVVAAFTRDPYALD